MLWEVGLLYRHVGRAADVLKEDEQGHKVVPNETAFFACVDAVSANIAYLWGAKGDYFF